MFYTGTIYFLYVARASSQFPVILFIFETHIDSAEFRRFVMLFRVIPTVTGFIGANVSRSNLRFILPYDNLVSSSLTPGRAGHRLVAGFPLTI